MRTQSSNFKLIKAKWESIFQKPTHFGDSTINQKEWNYVSHICPEEALLSSHFKSLWQQCQFFHPRVKPSSQTKIGLRLSKTTASKISHTVRVTSGINQLFVFRHTGVKSLDKDFLLYCAPGLFGRAPESSGNLILPRTIHKAGDRDGHFKLRHTVWHTLACLQRTKKKQYLWQITTV